MQEVKQEIEIEVSVKISEESIYDLICTALEGGTGYWCKLIQSSAMDVDLPFWHLDWYKQNDGWLYIVDQETGEKHTIDRKKIIEGLKLMAKKSTRHFKNFVDENYDAETGDVFWQYVVLGDIRYG